MSNAECGNTNVEFISVFLVNAFETTENTEFTEKPQSCRNRRGVLSLGSQRVALNDQTELSKFDIRKFFNRHSFALEFLSGPLCAFFCV